MAEIHKQQPLPDDPFQHDWNFADEQQRTAFLSSEHGRAAEFIRDYPVLDIPGSLGFPKDARHNTNVTLKNLPASPIFYLLDPEKFGSLFWYAIALSKVRSVTGNDNNPVYEGVNKMLTPILGWLEFADDSGELSKEIKNLRDRIQNELTLSVSNFKDNPRMTELLETRKTKMLGNISDPLWQEISADPKIQEKIQKLIYRFIRPFLETLAEERLELVTETPFSDLQFFVPERSALQLKDCLTEIAKTCQPATILTFEEERIVNPTTQESIPGTLVRVMTTHTPTEAEAKILQSFQSIDISDSSAEETFARMAARLTLNRRTSPAKSGQ